MSADLLLLNVLISLTKKQKAAWKIIASGKKDATCVSDLKKSDRHAVVIRTKLTRLCTLRERRSEFDFNREFFLFETEYGSGSSDYRIIPRFHRFPSW